jgi:hypothetical protein
MTVPGDERVPCADDPADGRNPPNGGNQSAARQDSGNRQGRVPAGVDPPGPLIEDMELSEDRAVSGRDGHHRPIGGQSVL